jgi:hypothetical protein
MNNPFAHLANMTPTCKTVHSTQLEWDVVPHADSTDFCADGDGIVVLRDCMTHFLLLDQGDVAVRLPNGYLTDTLEIAQQYLAVNYPAIFADQKI